MKERQVPRQQNPGKPAAVHAAQGRGEGAVDPIGPAVEQGPDPALARGPHVLDVAYGHAVRDEERCSHRQVPRQQPRRLGLDELGLALDLGVDLGPDTLLAPAPQLRVTVRARRLAHVGREQRQGDVTGDRAAVEGIAVVRPLADKPGGRIRGLEPAAKHLARGPAAYGQDELGLQALGVRRIAQDRVVGRHQVRDQGGVRA